MSIRFADSADIEVLKCLRLEFLAEDFGSLPDEAGALISGQLDTYFHERMGKDFFAAIAFDDNGQAASTAFLLTRRMPANQGVVNGKTAVLLNVYTRPEHRKKRLASKVLTLLIEKARELEVSRIELSAADGAKSLYEGLGFREKASAFTEMSLALN